MLENIFTGLLYMSIQAAVLILVVIFIRGIFRKLPRKYICLLWALAALRLMLPVTIESRFSLMPGVDSLESMLSVEMVSEELTGQAAGVQTGTSQAALLQENPASGNIMSDNSESGNLHWNNFPQSSFQEKGQMNIHGFPVDSLQREELSNGAVKGTGKSAVILIWLAGVMILSGYGVYSYLKVKRQVREAVHEKDNIWLCDRIDMPFLLGYIKPRIYIPFYIGEERRRYIIAHEQGHISRGDHMTKLIGYVLLAVYWFQPFVWIAYVLFCLDVEIACDEKVIAELGEQEKKNYSQTLLLCSMERYNLLGNPLAFGELNVKKRIKNVLDYKKPGLWIIVAAVVLLVAVGGLFLTSRSGEEAADEVMIAGDNTADVESNSAEGDSSANAEADDAAAVDTSPVSRKKWTGEESEIFVYSKTADITHDGIMDRVIFTVEPYPEAYEELPPELENYMELDVFTLFKKVMAEGHIYVYKGSDGRGNFEEEPLWHMGEIYWASVGNAQVSVLEEEGKGYLLRSNMYAGMDSIDYSYEVFSLDSEGNEIQKDESGVSFYVGGFDYGEGTGDLTEQMPEEAKLLTAFFERLNPWLENATLLVATDLSTEQGVFWSEEPEFNSVQAATYYQLIREQWFESEIQPQFSGFGDYTGYMHACKVWTGYQDFVDCDYDGDGLTDYVYRRSKKDNLCDYQIEFGNGDVILLEDSDASGWPIIQSEDLNMDGTKEILFSWEALFSTYPPAFGNMVLWEKAGEEYREAALPFATDPEEKWRTGLTLQYDFGGEDTFLVTVEETGIQAELTYGYSLEGWSDHSALAHVYSAQFVQDEEGPYLECLMGILDKYCSYHIEAKLIYKDGAYSIKDMDFSGFYSEVLPIQTDGEREYILEVNGSEYVFAGTRKIGRIYTMYDENNARLGVQTFEEENILDYTLADKNGDGFNDLQLHLSDEGEDTVTVNYIWDPEEKKYVAES